MHPRARELIATLGLTPHPEGGYYHQVFRSTLAVNPGDDRDARPASTAIYFLLAAGQPSRWHRIRSDEVWHFYEGAPLELFRLQGVETRCDRHLLGPARGEAAPVGIVPGGWWQAARTTGAYTLTGCSVAPGFVFDDFEMLADRPQAAAVLHRRFPELAGLI